MRPVLLPVLFALAVAGMPGCAAPPDDRTAADPAPVRIRVVDGVNMDVRDVPLLMAFDELTAAGHEVQPMYIAGNTLLADTMARGEAEVGIINNQTAWAAVANGADIRTVSEFTEYTGLIAATSGVRSCHDLHERPVAIPVTTGFAPLLFNLHLRSTCPDARPQILVIAEAPSRRAALIAGRIDAAQLPGEQLIALQQEFPGRYHALSMPSRESTGVRVDGLQVRGAWARENPGVVRMLLTAQLLAHRRIRANPSLLYEEAARRLKLDPDTAKAIADAHLREDIWPVDGGLTPGNVQSTIAFLVESGGLAAGLTADRVSDLSYLDAVLAEIGREDAASPGGSTGGASAP